ncbi:MAG: DUF4123 domain-containing protein [Bacteroidales bacterium]
MQRQISYIVFDAARMEAEIDNARAINPVFDSLYRGQSEETLSSVAPYIFTFERETEFRRWYFDKGWGDSWGIMLFADEEMKVLHKHFRKFLMVQTEEGKELYFRYYDPRVLRIFLPTCDKEQLKEFFGPIDYYICEDEDPVFGIVFSLLDGLLHQERISKEMIMDFEPPAKKKWFSFF